MTMKKIITIIAVLFAAISFSYGQIPLRAKIVNQIANGDTLQWYITPSNTYMNSTNPFNMVASQVNLSGQFNMLNYSNVLDSLKVNAALILPTSVVRDAYNDTILDLLTNTSTRIGYMAGKNNKAIENTFIGYLSGTNTATGVRNTFVGYEAGRYVLTNGNVGVGYNAVRSSSGTYGQNTGVGQWALTSVSTGYSNTAVGFDCMNNNAIGYNNAALGLDALYMNNGNDNVGVGQGAGYHSKTNSNYNVFIGSNAGRGVGGLFDTPLANNYGNVIIGYNANQDLSTSDTGKVAIGYNAGHQDTVSTNMYMGAWAGYSNVSSLYNTFIGHKSGFLTIGTENTFLGWNSGTATTTGNRNTFLGTNAGATNTGSDNTYIGRNAGLQATSGTVNAIFGSDAGYSMLGASNNAFFGSEAGRNNTTGGINTAIGRLAGYSLGAGVENTMIGTAAGYTTTGNYNTFLGTWAGYSNNGSGNIFIGYNSGYNELGSNKLYIDNSNATTPLLYGEFDNNILNVNGKAGVNILSSVYGPTAANTPYHQLSVLSSITDAFGITFPTNKNRSSSTQFCDTSAFCTSFTGGGTPMYSIIGKAGNTVFDINQAGVDSVGRFRFVYGTPTTTRVLNTPASGYFYSDASGYGPVVANTMSSSTTSGGVLRLAQFGGAALTMGQRLGILSFGGSFSTGVTQNAASSSIQAFADGTWSSTSDNGSYITISGKPDGATIGTIEAQRLGLGKSCTDNSATNLFNITCAAGSNFGIIVNYTCRTTGGAGNESHTETGTLFIQVANDGSVTTTPTKSINAQHKTDAGTYTVTFAASAANPSVVSVTADSDLNVGTIITYNIVHSDGATITQL